MVVVFCGLSCDCHDCADCLWWWFVVVMLRMVVFGGYGGDF